jgi:hypothetical protein
VHEKVLTSLFRHDETKSFFVAEPFDGSDFALFHDAALNPMNA